MPAWWLMLTVKCTNTVTFCVWSGVDFLIFIIPFEDIMCYYTQMRVPLLQCLQSSIIVTSALINRNSMVPTSNVLVIGTVPTNKVLAIGTVPTYEFRKTCSQVFLRNSDFWIFVAPGSSPMGSIDPKKNRVLFPHETDHLNKFYHNRIKTTPYSVFSRKPYIHTILSTYGFSWSWNLNFRCPLPPHVLGLF